MPVLGGIMSSLFGVVFAILAKRLAMGLAASAAFLALTAAAFLAAKLAIFTLFASISLVVPANVVAALQSFMPTHGALYVGLVLLAQSVRSAFDYWRVNLAVAFQLANA